MNALTRSDPRPNPAVRFLDALAGPSTLAAIGYLLGGWLVPVLLFSVVVTVVSTALGLAVTVIALPLLLGAAFTIHGCAAVERYRAAPVLGAPIPAPHRRVPTRPGLLGRLRSEWSDPATWRELVYLVAVFPFIYAFDVVVGSLWAAALGTISTPAWYWSIPQSFPDGSHDHGLAYGWFPHGPDGEGAIGVFIGDPATAVAVAVIFIPILAAAGLLVRAAARVHARLAVALLGPVADPMAPARDVLAAASPLPALSTPAMTTAASPPTVSPEQ